MVIDSLDCNSRRGQDPLSNRTLVLKTELTRGTPQIAENIGNWTSTLLKGYKVQSYREGEISYDIPYKWNLKRNDTNELNEKRLTDFKKEMTSA